MAALLQVTCTSRSFASAPNGFSSSMEMECKTQRIKTVTNVKIPQGSLKCLFCERGSGAQNLAESPQIHTVNKIIFQQVNDIQVPVLHISSKSAKTEISPLAMLELLLCKQVAANRWAFGPQRHHERRHQPVDDQQHEGGLERTNGCQCWNNKKDVETSQCPSSMTKIHISQRNSGNARLTGPV